MLDLFHLLAVQDQLSPVCLRRVQQGMYRLLDLEGMQSLVRREFQEQALVAVKGFDLGKRPPDNDPSLVEQGRVVTDPLHKVVSEARIRGTVEKTYAATFDLNDADAMIGEDPGKMYMQMFLQYMLTFAKQFQTYCDTPGIDIKNDRSGFSLSYVYLTDEELEETVAAISKILTPLQNDRPAPDRKLRTIGVIVSPEQHDTK